MSHRDSLDRHRRSSNAISRIANRLEDELPELSLDVDRSVGEALVAPPICLPNRMLFG